MPRAPCELGPWRGQACSGPPCPWRRVELPQEVGTDSGFQRIPAYLVIPYIGISSVGHSVVSDSLRPHGLQPARLPCPLPTPGACANSCPSYTPNLSNGVSSQKCPGILNSKAMGLLRRARVSQSKKEGDSESFPQQLLSSWHQHSCRHHQREFMLCAHRPAPPLSALL